MLHQPGYGISNAPNRARSAGKRNMPTRILRILSRSRCSTESLLLSIIIVLSFHVMVAPRDSMIERNVRTSPIFGTLWRVKWSKKSHAARSGRAAFLEPEILTVPERDCGQVILSKGGKIGNKYYLVFRFFCHPVGIPFRFILYDSKNLVLVSAIKRDFSASLEMTKRNNVTFLFYPNHHVLQYFLSIFL